MAFGRQLDWDKMDRVERFLFPGLNPSERSTGPNEARMERIGQASKLLLPSLILVGGWALQGRPLIANMSLILLSNGAIWADIRSQGQLRTFETGISLLLPSFIASAYNTYCEPINFHPIAFDQFLADCALLFAIIPPTALYSRLMDREKKLKKEFTDSTKQHFPNIYDSYIESALQCFCSQVAQLLLPSVGFALYKTLSPHFALLGWLGVGAAALWTSEKYCTAEGAAQADKRSLQASTAGLLIAAIIGFGVSSWPRG